MYLVYTFDYSLIVICERMEQYLEDLCLICMAYEYWIIGLFNLKQRETKIFILIDSTLTISLSLV